jgi:hypothetical protein
MADSKMVAALLPKCVPCHHRSPAAAVGVMPARQRRRGARRGPALSQQSRRRRPPPALPRGAARPPPPALAHRCARLCLPAQACLRPGRRREGQCVVFFVSKKCDHTF